MPMPITLLLSACLYLSCLCSPPPAALMDCRSLSKAHEKFMKDFPSGPPPMPEVAIPDPSSVCVPPPPAPSKSKGAGSGKI